MSDYIDSEESRTFVTPAVRYFGHDEFTNANAEIVRDLIRQGSQPTAAAVLAATYQCQVEVLEILLYAGGNANARRQTACLDGQTTQYDSFESNQDITADTREWYAIQFAAQFPDPVPVRQTDVEFAKDKARRRKTMQLLLQHGVDLYKTVKQPLWPSIPGPFPGEGITFIDHYAWENAVPDRRDLWSSEYAHEPQQRSPTPLAGHIPRCIIHALFEDGGYMAPLLEHIDLEHRDPLGRTILQSACRSMIGADAAIDLTIQDMLQDQYKHCCTTRPVANSTFATLVSMGADIEAVDHSGRTVIHHLLEARFHDTWMLAWVPLIRSSLKSVIASHPHLIHQANDHGLTPQFCALRRLRACSTIRVLWAKDLERAEDAVNDLLDAGADPLAVDARGNTALHYVVECGVFQVDEAVSIRLLMARYLKAGVDINARNLHGKTALEALFTINERFEELRSEFVSSEKRYADRSDECPQVEDEVFAMLDAAGANWTAKTAADRTLLHLLAETDMYILQPTRRAESLLTRGVDLAARDSSGQTAKEVAEAAGNQHFLEFVAEHEASVGKSVT